MIASDDAEYIYRFPYTDVAAAVMGACAENSEYASSSSDQVQRCVELASARAKKNQEDDEYCTVSSSEESDLSDELREEMLEEGEVELILVSRKVRLSIATVPSKNLSIILWYRPHRPTLKLPSLASVTSQQKNSLEIKYTPNSL